MRVVDTSDLWWRTAVFYNIDVERFMDWDGDGVGDLEGVAHRIDHLRELGVTCLWFAPFMPSPRRDNGYDIADHYGVDPRYGHLGDLVEVIRTAKDRGMRVVADLVVNHTSIDHPWFEAARADRDSPYRDYYVWRDEVPDDQPENMFPDAEDGVWFLDEQSGQHYRHTFYRHQPDLNIANPAVRAEIAKIMGFWLQLGLDGFRVDAVPSLIEGEEGPEHDLLRDLRLHLSRRNGSAVMLGEVNLPYERQLEFFGGEDGDELSLQFDFPLNQALYLALARQDAGPVAASLRARPAIAAENQWANFVRNHDELTLDQLSDAEREEVFAAFAPEERQRAQGRGIVRRLPGMLDGDEARMRMVYSLLFSLPGAPVLLWGEEIGMAEDPRPVSSRAAVRSPMQWSNEVNGGFSQADPDDLVTPTVPGPRSFAHVNVEDQRDDPESFLTFIRTLIARYRSTPAIGWGGCTVLDSGTSGVLAHLITGEDARLLALHDFSGKGGTVRVRVPDAPAGTRALAQLREAAHEVDADGLLEIELEPYGHRWLRILRPGERRTG